MTEAVARPPSLSVERLPTGAYAVACGGSCGGDGVAHIITIDGDAASCDCPGHAFRHGCRHVDAVTAYLILAPLETASAGGPGLVDRDVPPEPQAALIDGMTDEELLDVLGPSDAGTPRAAPARAAEHREPLLRSLAELLADPDALKPPAAIVPRCAFCGRVTLLVGREKLGGKSTLLTAAAAAVTRGAEFLGEPCAAGDVLWVTADQEHAHEITQRAVRFGADPARFHVLWPHEPFADLQAALAWVRPVLLIIDTLASFARTVVSDPHSSAEWPAVLLPLLTSARELEIAVVIAHHAKKNEGGGYRDSSAIGALVDMLLELLPDTGNPARRNVTALGRWPAPNFAVELVGDRYQLLAGGELSLDAQLLLYIEANPRCSKAAIRASVGKRAEDVDLALGRLVTRGAVRNAGGDRRHAYIAVAAEPQAVEEEPDALPF